MKPKRKPRERTDWKSRYAVVSQSLERSDKEVSDLTYRLQLAEKLGNAQAQAAIGHKAQITSLQHQIEVGDALIAKQRDELIKLRSQPKPWWAKSFRELLHRRGSIS